MTFCPLTGHGIYFVKIMFSLAREQGASLYNQGEK